MASETDNFYLCGPSHLTYENVNWDNKCDRKSIVSCLVNGVYVLENDRQKCRKGPNSLACKWWEFFHFQLLDTLIDDKDSSIFGAIFEFKPQPSMWNGTLHRSPRYVIAFRGTAFKQETFLRDLELDLKIAMHTLHQDSRSKIATEKVRKMVASVGGNCSNIWLAGHSLGSSIALLAGKTMAKKGIFIESFLFNPPFPSVPINQIINNEKVKKVFGLGGSVFKVGVRRITMNSDERRSSRDSFSALSGWIPNLFVNSSDLICSKYVEYFERRIYMEKIGAGWLEKRSTQNSVGCQTISRVLGKEAEPVHLIPSANLTVNSTPPSPLQSIKQLADLFHQRLEAHGVHRWWEPNLQLKFEQHKYKY